MASVNNLAYDIVPLGNRNGLNLYGVQFNGKNKFMYWFKSGGQIKKVKVVLDAKNENTSLDPETIILSLKGINEYNDLRTAIIIFLRIMKSYQINNLQIKFIIDNNNQKEVISSVCQEIGIPYTLELSNQSINDLNNKSETIKKVEEMQENNITASGSKTITTDDIRGIRQVTITADGSKAFENIGSLTINEKKKILLEEWLNDPFMSVRIKNLSPEELDELLTENITRTLTTYRMESAHEQTSVASSDKEKAQATIDKTRQEDGLSNKDLGIVKNNVSNQSYNAYSSVEREIGGIEVVTPDVSNATITAQTSTSIYNDGTVNKSYNSQVINSTDEEQSRDETLPVYFIDEDEFKLYDSYEDYLNQNESKITEQKCYPDIVNYTLNDATGRAIGRLANVKSMDKSPDTLTQSKDHTLRLVKRKEEPYKSAAFVNLSAIIFILSAFLILGAIILLLNI